MKYIHFRRGILLLIKPGCLHHGTTGIVVEAVLCMAGCPAGATRCQQRLRPGSTVTLSTALPRQIPCMHIFTP